MARLKASLIVRPKSAMMGLCPNATEDSRMRQRTFADEGVEKHRKKTRRERSLDRMGTVVPWRELHAVVELHYPKPAGRGRPPIGLDRMLRIHFLQHWFNLSDPAAEEALHDSRALSALRGDRPRSRGGAGRDDDLQVPASPRGAGSGREAVRAVNRHLADNHLKVSTGTIIVAPSSTRNGVRARDPEMRLMRKGRQWRS